LAIYAIADLHLSFGSAKPMDMFAGWEDYVRRLEENWRAAVTEHDTVVLPGDISWGMSLEEALPDFAFLHGLPGTKIVMKGNHDYWWTTKTKADKFFAEHGLNTLRILNNNAYRFGDVTVCGTRGWFFDCEAVEDKKVLLREAGRLRMSIQAGRDLGGELIAFLHYPPITGDGICCHEIFDILVEEHIGRCYYGHLHGPACRNSLNGEVQGVRFSLISGDYLGFYPKLVSRF